MSVEEWLLFHANPTIEALSQPLIKKTFSRIQYCGCRCVTDAICYHLTAEKAIDFAASLKRLGFRATDLFVLFFLRCFEFKNCTQFLDAFRFIPTSDFIWKLPYWLNPCDDDEIVWYDTDEEKDIVIRLVDQCPAIETNKPLPAFIRDFLENRKASAIGAIHTMHAMKRMVGKDVARMIGRVVWAGRKYYSPTCERLNKK